MVTCCIQVLYDQFSIWGNYSFIFSKRFSGYVSNFVCDIYANCPNRFFDVKGKVMAGDLLADVR
ncbi:MAG: hypothetical protein BGO39_25430 [Chloroflexi bacterium 54-19]|nr:MAG: hypothetical protein BGO39_25430 [Chloroflexi bacterium 54-19]